MASKSQIMLSAPPSCLYHYCSNDALISILHSNSLRLSLLSLSNDYMEGRWIRSVFVKACKKREFPDWKLEALSQSFDILVSIINAGGFCMSKEGDLLSQWRGYADQGRGVSIGFSGEYLTKLCEASRGNAKFGISLQMVDYDIETQDKNIAPTIDMIAERAENVQRYPNLGSIMPSPEEYESAVKEHSSAIRSMTLPVLLLFGNLYTSKNPAFREEQEWRLIAVVPTGGPNGEMLTDCDFRASGDRIIPFIPVSMLDYGVRPIDRIILGPRNQTPPEVVRALLARHGILGATVERSTASFR